MRTIPLYRVCILLLIVLALMASCQSGQRADSDERPFVSLPGHEPSPDGVISSSFDPDYFYSLEERIAASDVVGRVLLQSTNAVATQDYLFKTQEELDHMVALEYTFNVVEYLKGTGDAQVTAVVTVYKDYDTVAEAEAAKADSLALHDTHWDSREGIVFLDDDLPQGNGSKLRLGWTGPTNSDSDDYYSIASCCARFWLPAASVNSGSESSSRQQSSPTFLLEVPSDSGPSAQDGQPGPRTAGATSMSNPPTITLADLRSKVASIEQEIADGGGSDAYRECIRLKYQEKGWVDALKETHFPDGGYFQRRHDEQIASGLPAGTVAYTSDNQALGWQEGDPIRGEFWVTKHDAEFFEGKYPGVAVTTRALPAGEYRFYFGWISSRHIPCNALPEEELQRQEVFVTVTAPTGTVHEAFFDPVSSGDAVGYFGTGDALKPTTFSKGDTSTTIQSLQYDDSAVTLGLSPYNALEEHILDFITGDGTTTLSLEASAATGDSTVGTLTWAVGSQPWSSGDELMLRLRESQTTPSFGQDSYSFSVPESTSLWSTIGTVKAIDQDGDAVLHKITSGNDGGRFGIDGWEGLILLFRELDYETKTSYELTVTGTDPGGRSDSTTVTIEVTDVAE